ncbi:very short patch repair endonuclease [Aestuariivirga sp.]|uniref:very short patch repair endonuclease n=1 Tax=Aestuariivirga sp. TaxID=2650926 RepID=UPI0025BE3D32|nr:very short patch repair endonuclease [Aestuariivirga sp.]MCA3555241.1 DNA mismatch endonuclease Vsr [Aestuariivirga sp.]
MGRAKKASETRSRTMRAVASRSTSAEIAIRSMIRPLGFRMRFNVSGLPGKPDIVIHSLKTANFVNGCFWHGHNCKRGRRLPKTNTAYWIAKISSNRARDRLSRNLLRRSGWRVISIWECESVGAKARKLRFLRQATKT